MSAFNKPTSRKRLWWAIAIIVVAGVIVWRYTSSGNADKPVAGAEQAQKGKTGESRWTPWRQRNARTGASLGNSHVQCA